MPFEGFPIVIGLELTLACNLRCRHCASAATTRSRSNELSLEELLSICDQFPDLFVQEVDITGGEPLLRPEWFAVTTHLNKLGIPVRMVTNGSLLKENVPQLKESGIATVGISLDGLEATHDRIRERPGLFRTIVGGIESALKAGIPIAVITAVNDINIEELQALETFICNLGIEHWQVQPTFSLGRAKESELTLSNETFLELGSFIQCRQEPCSSSMINLVPADGVGYFSSLDSRTRAWSGCAAGISSCGITSNGLIKGCLSMPDRYVEGSLRERELWDIWFDENSFSATRRFSTADLGDNCTACEHGEACKGGCSVMSIAATGKYHNNPYCFHRLLKEQPAIVG
ncbi:MAG: radical SAM protein [Chlorobiaceae bacterium]|nr:radical SAM protein [Chlorobiaceae bacterium]